MGFCLEEELCTRVHVRARACGCHLQTEGTHVPGRAGAGVLAADWPPRQTAPLCATPGCPQCLKTESINREVVWREGRQRKEEIKKEKKQGSDQQMDRDVGKGGQTENKCFS